MFIPALVDMSKKSVRDATLGRLAMEEFSLAEQIKLDELPLDTQNKVLHECRGSADETAKVLALLVADLLMQRRDLSTAESRFLVNRVWTVKSVECQEGGVYEIPSLQQSFCRDYQKVYEVPKKLDELALEAVNELLKRAQHELLISSMEVYKNIYEALYTPKTELLLDKDLVFRHMRGEIISNDELISAARAKKQEAFFTLYSTAVWIHSAVLPKDMQMLMNTVVYQSLKDVFAEGLENGQMNGTSEPTKLKGEKI